ncbi:MAG: hypothetical protein OEX13_00945 [Gammaproteobacteria bacterium]|nr:hypothetical protein [Gammaproteobacteria bacterium]
MSNARKAIYAAGAVVAAVLAVGVFLPSTGVVERQISTIANRSIVFALINDQRQAGKWLPWPESDPNVHLEFAGARRGPGAMLSWDGSIVGRGSQTIDSSLAPEYVHGTLELDGMGDGASRFTLARQDSDTLVTWRFETRFGRNLLQRYLGLMLDRRVGASMERGLANLVELAESLPPHDFSDLEIEHFVVESTDIALLPTSSEPLAAAISEALGDAYFQILAFIDRNGLKESGAPLSISRAFSGAELRFDAGIPVRGISDSTPPTDGAVRLARTYGGPVIRVKHVGSYVALARTHDKIGAYLAAMGMERNGDAWESYVSDPTQTAESELITYLYYPVKPDR